MRVFSHSNFDSVPDPMMPAFGQYNEDAIQRLDLALVAAAQNGIRLILVLGNYWPFLGGETYILVKILVLLHHTRKFH